jgi:hypothetical protein
MLGVFGLIVEFVAAILASVSIWIAGSFTNVEISQHGAVEDRCYCLARLRTLQKLSGQQSHIDSYGPSGHSEAA